MRRIRRRRPMLDYVRSGRYDRDQAKQAAINKAEDDKRNSEIKRLGRSPKLADQITAIIAKCDWHNHQAYMIPWNSKKTAETATEIAEFVKKNFRRVR